jgi:hypothetical protein
MLSGVSLLLGVLGQSQATGDLEMGHTGLPKKVGEQRKKNNNPCAGEGYERNV